MARLAPAALIHVEQLGQKIGGVQRGRLVSSNARQIASSRASVTLVSAVMAG